MPIWQRLLANQLGGFEYNSRCLKWFFRKVPRKLPSAFFSSIKIWENTTLVTWLKCLVIAYCQQNRHVRLAFYTNLLTLIWWIFTFRKVNKLIEFTKISNLYSYNDTGSTFKQPLQLSKNFSVHHKDIQILTRAVYKIVNNIYPPIMKIFFSWRRKQMQPSKFQRQKAAKNKNG